MLFNKLLHIIRVVTFEETLGFLLVEGEQLTSGLTDLGQGVLDPPDFTLVTKTVFTDEFQLLVQTGLLEGATRSDAHLPLNERSTVVHHSVVSACTDK